LLFALHSLVFSHPRHLLSQSILREVRELGYSAVELIPIDYDRDDVKRLKGLCREIGLEIVVGWSLSAEHHLADPALCAAGVAQLKELVDLAAEVEAPILAGVNYAGCGYLTGRPPSEAELERAANAYREVADYALARTPTVLCLEPATRHDSHLINTARQALRFCDVVDRSNVGLLLDTFQMLREENSVGGAIREASGRIGYFHVSESHRGTPGTGTVPWSEVGQALHDVEYDGWIGVEAFFDVDAVVAPRAGVWRQLEKDPLTLARAAMLHMRAMFGP
jgi:D-psicose/D-tagatose/L-ribulose 3-epimerase